MVQTVELEYSRKDHLSEERKRIEEVNLPEVVVTFPYSQVSLLFVLYVVQAIPMGLSMALPLVLQNRGATYTEIAAYAIASLPFSLKLLWAPIVDSTHFPDVGRRKSWLIPTQLLCALLLFFVGNGGWLTSWTGENGDPINVSKLTMVFFTIYVLMATQDIAVDGWAIEILPPPFKKHASTCNAIGQTVGTYTSSLIFLFLNDPDACNRWFRSKPKPYGIVSIGGFVNVCGWVLLLVTIYVGYFVKEDFTCTQDGFASGRDLDATNRSVDKISDFSKAEPPETAIRNSYWFLLRMIRLRPVQIACLFLLTVRIPFGTIDGALQLKMVEAGVRKEEVALLSPFVIPWGVMASYSAGKVINRRWSALQALKVGFAFRLALILVWIVVFLIVRDVYAPFIASNEWRNAKAAFWILMYVCACIQTLATEFMFACQIAFFAEVSDPAIGGTAMTFFNTLANLGGKVPGMVSLMLMERTRFASAEPFVVLAALGFLIGIFWILSFGNKIILTLDSFPVEAWRLRLQWQKTNGNESLEETIHASNVVNRKLTPCAGNDYSQ